jgi:hypothetical protein
MVEERKQQPHLEEATEHDQAISSQENLKEAPLECWSCESPLPNKDKK